MNERFGRWEDGPARILLRDGPQILVRRIRFKCDRETGLISDYEVDDPDVLMLPHLEDIVAIVRDIPRSVRESPNREEGE